MIDKIAYAVFIGILFAAVAIVGITTFYPSPKYPEYPPFPSVETYPESVNSEEELSSRQEQAKKEREEFIDIDKEFKSKQEIYSTNHSVISLSLALVFLIAGTMMVKKLAFISEGLMIGGVIVLLYSFMSSLIISLEFNNIIRFVIVVVGLCVSLILGYFRLRPVGTK